MINVNEVREMMKYNFDQFLTEIEAAIKKAALSGYWMMYIDCPNEYSHKEIELTRLVMIGNGFSCNVDYIHGRDGSYNRLKISWAI